MDIAGVVCEYNPFHKGHGYVLNCIREALGNDTGIICAMSGNFVQRGEPAVFSKHQRAEMAILGGADLVVEIPLPWVLSSAEKYAYGGVSILNAAGVCSHIMFGSEEGDIESLSRVAECLASPEIDELIKDELQNGISYADARQKAAEKLLENDAELLSKPNNILGIEYLKALKKLNSDIIPITVKRKGAAHDSGTDTHDDGFVSASLIRELLKSGESLEKISGYVPECTLSILKREYTDGKSPIGISKMEMGIMAKLRTMRECEFEALPDNAEGLHRRLMEFSRKCSTVSDIITETKTKRYAHSRIRRMIMCAYLGIKAADSEGIPPYIRVLGFNDRGREILKQMKEKSKLPIITKPASAKELDDRGRAIFETESLGTDLYNLCHENEAFRKGGQEWSVGPVRVL